MRFAEDGSGRETTSCRRGMTFRSRPAMQRERIDGLRLVVPDPAVADARHIDEGGRNQDRREDRQPRAARGSTGIREMGERNSADCDSLARGWTDAVIFYFE